MTGLTHNQFIKLFSDLATAHKNINSFGTGDLWEYMANESDTIRPVTLWVVIQAETLQGKTGKPKYTLVVMDAVDKGQENIDEVYSDTKRIAQDLVSLLRQPYYESFFTIEQNVVFEPFSEKFDSEMAGHQFDLVFNQPFLYDACEVNIDGLPAINMDSIYINTTTNTSKYLMRQHAVYQLTSTTNVQKLFNGSTNGRITLPVGAYKFTCQFYLDSMSATPGNSSFSFVAGTAVLTNFLMQVVGFDAAPVTAAGNENGSGAITNAFTASMHTPSASTRQLSFITGTFEVTTAGTVTPSIQLVTAAAANVNIGSYIEIERMGADTVTSVGSWD